MSLISHDRLDVLRICADMVKHLPGNAIEVGVYQGGSLKVIAQAMPHKTVYGYDTFEGLPVEKSSDKEVHKPGEFSDTSLESVTSNLGNCGVRNFKLRKGLFPDCLGENEGPNLLCFAHLDVDFEQATRECLEWVASRLCSGGIIVIDDYDWQNCPMVKPVVDEFVKPVMVKVQTGFSYTGPLMTKTEWEFYQPLPQQCWIRKK